MVPLQGPLQTGVDDLATGAHHLGLGDLGDGGTGVADGEEELRVNGETCGLAAPVHKGPLQGHRSCGWRRPNLSGNGGRVREQLSHDGGRWARPRS